MSELHPLISGINNSISDELIEPTELSDGRNYMPDRLNRGVLIKRPGLTREVTTQLTEAATSIYEGIEQNYFTTSTAIRRMNAAGTSLTAALTSTTAPDWTSLAGRDIYANGSDAPRRSNGAGAATVVLGGTPPTFKYVEAYNNFVFGAGHSTGVLRWSDVGTIETWTAANSLTLTNNQNDDINGLIKYLDALFIFCRKSFYQVRGFATNAISIVGANYNEGCTSHRSLIVTPFGLFWWSQAGLAWTRDGITISYPTQEKIPNTIERLNRNLYTRVHGVWHPRFECVEMFCFNGSATSENIAFFFFPRDNSLWIMSGLGTEMSASGMVTASGVADVYLGSNITTGYVFKQDGELDDTTPIAAYAETKRDVTQFGIKAKKRASILTPMFIAVDTGTIDYGVYIDNAVSLTKTWTIPISQPAGTFVLGTSLLNTGILGASTEAQEYPIGYDREFRKIKHRLGDNSAIRTRIRGMIVEGTLVSA